MLQAGHPWTSGKPSMACSRIPATSSFYFANLVVAILILERRAIQGEVKNFTSMLSLFVI
jgi:hypothetical protein